MWTMDNTEGFTQEQLDLINVIHAELVADGMQPKAASDLINNSWNENINTAENLRRAVKRL